MYDVVLAPNAVRDLRALMSTDELSVRRVIAQLRDAGFSRLEATRIPQTGRPGLFSIRASPRLRLIASPIGDTVIGLFAIGSKSDLDAVLRAVAAIQGLAIPEPELAAAHSVLYESVGAEDEAIRADLARAAPHVLQAAEAAARKDARWDAIGAAGTWIGVLIAVVTLILASRSRQPVNNYYINVEHVIHVIDVD